ncbi:hypothetical protein HFP72_03655 [Nocardiopsis sp. ARC36]
MAGVSRRGRHPPLRLPRGDRGQDRWLQDPANNPHAFDTLTPEQRGMVDAYTRSAWITRVARIRPFLPQTVTRQLMEWRAQSRSEAADPDTAQTAHGWDLYEANGLSWPSVERLRQIAASPQPLPPRTRGLIRYVLDAPDPRAELDHWFHNAGYAGVIARLNGGVYPDAAETRRLFRLLDGAVDRPLPEGMAVSRGMQSIDHLLRTTGGTDPRRLVGTVHTEPGYMSTTLGDSPFKTDVDGFPFLLRLDVPQGSHGLWIGTRSHDPEQMELTLGRGTTYRITGVQDRIDPESGGPQTVVTATVVPLPRAVPDLFSEGSTGEDGVRRFWNAEEAHWYGHRLHDPAHNPHAVNALPRARHDLVRALSALAPGVDLTLADPEGARELLDSLRAASRVTPGSTPAEQQRVLGWELYEANGLTWPSPDRLLQLLPAERVRNPARARFITDLLRHGPQEAARRLGGLYNAAGPAGVLARANGAPTPRPRGCWTCWPPTRTPSAVRCPTRSRAPGTRTPRRRGSSGTGSTRTTPPRWSGPSRSPGDTPRSRSTRGRPPRAKGLLRSSVSSCRRGPTASGWAARAPAPRTRRSSSRRGPSSGSTPWTRPAADP